jgi:hypothetical protein
LLCGLRDLDGFIFVVVLLIFLIVDEPSGVISKLACCQLSLHNEIGGGCAHLPSKISKPGLRHNLLKGSLQLINLFLLCCQLFLKLLDLGFEFKDGIIIATAGRVSSNNRR